MDKGGGIRALKRQAELLLRADDFTQRLPEWRQFPARQIINPLFSFLCSHEEWLKMRAVTAMGVVAAQLADKDMESARVIMRRLIWNLNDESGGIGWGCPEAMGEIMASHEGIAREYSPILISLIREDGNLLDHEALLRGALWGIGRLAESKPHLLRDCSPYLLPYLQSPDAALRGLAAWALGSLGASSASSPLRSLSDDSSEIPLYIENQLKYYEVRELAIRALSFLNTEPLNQTDPRSKP